MTTIEPRRAKNGPRYQWVVLFFVLGLPALYTVGLALGYTL